MWSQFLGFGMDAYDMAMVVVLTPVLSKTFASLAYEGKRGKAQ